ncbi:hypothetical protein GGH15_006502, partial [Coemansia sp. RSA 562]
MASKVESDDDITGDVTDDDSDCDSFVTAEEWYDELQVTDDEMDYEEPGPHKRGRDTWLDPQTNKRIRLATLAVVDVGAVTADSAQRPLAEIVIKGQTVQALLDSGASKSFIAPGLVKKLHLPTEWCPAMRARTADGKEQVVNRR